MRPPGRTSPAEDAPLLDGIRARDTQALDRLYRTHGAQVHGLALRIVQDTSEAEEVTQDVFLYVWQQSERFDATRGTLSSWLVTLARSRSIDRLRARGSRDRRHEGLAREAETGPDAAALAADPLQHAVEAERRERIRSALARLPEEQRRALEIAYFEGLSHSEIAARLETPLGTVKTRIRQGMIRLRDALQQP